MTGINLPIPENEKKRLEALGRYNIMDTLPEKEFEDIAALASYICNVPIAHVSFIDDKRQWFKAKVGMDAYDMPREETFCQYTIMQPDMVYVPDATRHEVFKDNPHVKGDFHIRFYAGVPLTTPDGYNIGTFCVVDTQVKELTPQQINTLSMLARHVMALMELRVKNIDLELAKEIAEKAVTARDAFLGNMSHEIRTPMNAIVGFTQLLSQTGLNEEQREYVAYVEKAGQNLLVLINDILDLSKIESGNLLIENTPFDLKDVLKHLQDLLQHKNKNSNTTIKLSIGTDIPDFVMGDKYRLNQVLMNLAGNAVKFTEQGEVVISVEKLGEKNGYHQLKFSVKDTGIGMTPEQLTIIFDRFTQAEESTTRRFGGTGLGLSIVKQLLELMNSEIKVESAEGKGSEFYFIMDFTEAAAVEQMDTAVAVNLKNNENKISVLLCEDNELNQNLAGRIIHNFGFDLDIANNGLEGIEMLYKKKYDVVLMDIQMPVMDGYQATRMIRETMKSDIPIIALTAHSLIGEQNKCREYGMDDYISKPFKPAALLEKIQSVIK